MREIRRQSPAKRNRLSSSAVPSRYLHPLVCTKCGAALPAEDGQQILVCPYCGQSHAFVPPPLEPGPGQRAWPASTTATLRYVLFGLGVVVAAAIALTAALAARNASVSPAAGSVPATESTSVGPGDPKAVYRKGQLV